MAKYLWVGADLTGISFDYTNVDGAQHTDQYCWNISGNWKIWSFNTAYGIPQWVDTWEIPKPGDVVIVGDDGVATSGGSTATGWIPARTPLLWGGYSGGVALGSWSKTGNTETGTTLTSSLQSFSFSEGLPGSPRENAYNFPYLGGGLSGPVLDWVSNRDGLPKHYYTSEWTNTGRNPRNNLTLKVSESVNLKTYRDPNYYRSGITNPAEINATNRMIMDFAFVKSLIGSGPSGASAPICNTRLVYNKHETMLGQSNNGNTYTLVYPRTPGLRITGGAFASIQLQPRQPFFFSSLAPYTNIGSDYGVYLTNVSALYVECQKKQAMYFTGCTFSWLAVDQYGYAGTLGSGGQYFEQVPIEIASNFDSAYIYNDLLGSSFNASTSPYGNGVLQLTNNAVQTVNYPYTAIPTGQSPSVVYDVTQRNEDLTQQVLLGDRFGTSTINIPTILIEAPQSGFHYMPWGLEFAGTVINNIIKNQGALVYSNNDMSEQKYVSCNLMNMSKHARLDLSRNQMNFDDWRFGGISGNTIIGGIAFEDETARVQGSEGVRLWNTQIRGKRFDSRSGAAITQVSGEGL
jgi:hypothetical protein